MADFEKSKDEAVRLPSQSYISDELTHFVGRDNKTGDQKIRDEKTLNKQYEVLTDVLKEGCLKHYTYVKEKHEMVPIFDPERQSNMGGSWMYKISEDKMFKQEMICLSDIPKRYLSIHMYKYSPFGLSFRKDFIVENGGSPVFYIAKHAKIPTDTLKVSVEEEKRLRKIGRYKDACISIEKAPHFDQKVKEFLELFSDGSIAETGRVNAKLAKSILDMRDFIIRHLLGYVKFFDDTLQDNHKDNYYFEREWRLNGWLWFEPKNVKTIIIPRKYETDFRKDFPVYSERVKLADYINDMWQVQTDENM